MQVFIYKSTRKDETYVYLRERDGFAVVPRALRDLLGNLQFAMELTLTPERKLARVAVAQVMAQLQAQGYFVQMPPLPGSANFIQQANSKLN